MGELFAGAAIPARGQPRKHEADDGQPGPADANPLDDWLSDDFTVILYNPWRHVAAWDTTIYHDRTLALARPNPGTKHQTPLWS